MPDPKPMRKKLHELVESGRIQEAIVEAAKHYGFRHLKIEDPGPDGFNFSIDVLKVDNGDFYAIEDTLCVGAYVIPMYERLAARDVAVPVDGIIELRVSHEEGHTGRGAEYPVDEVMNAQQRSGIDIRIHEAKVQRESLANSYAFGKCMEGRSPAEFFELISGQIWQCTFYPAYMFLESRPDFTVDSLARVAKDDKEVAEMAYNHAMHSGYCNLLEPEYLNMVIGKVVEIDNAYRSKLTGGPSGNG